MTKEKRTEYIKIDKSKIKMQGLTELNEEEGRVGLITLGGEYPPNCIVLFVDLDHWQQVKDRVYA